MRDASHYGDGPFQAEIAPAATDLWQAALAFDPSAPLSSHIIWVYANEGRWIAECPCGGAQLASQTDPRFMCNECANAHLSGHWARLGWPDDRDAIEDVLRARPVRHQNWLPGESVEQLFVENESYGLAV